MSGLAAVLCHPWVSTRAKTANRQLPEDLNHGKELHNGTRIGIIDMYDCASLLHANHTVKGTTGLLYGLCSTDATCYKPAGCLHLLVWWKCGRSPMQSCYEAAGR